MKLFNVYNKKLCFYNIVQITNKPKVLFYSLNLSVLILKNYNFILNKDYSIFKVFKLIFIESLVEFLSFLVFQSSNIN